MASAPTPLLILVTSGFGRGCELCAVSRSVLMLLVSRTTRARLLTVAGGRQLDRTGHRPLGDRTR